MNDVDRRLLCGCATVLTYAIKLYRDEHKTNPRWIQMSLALWPYVLADGIRHGAAALPVKDGDRFRFEGIEVRIVDGCGYPFLVGCDGRSVYL